MGANRTYTLKSWEEVFHLHLHDITAALARVRPNLLLDALFKLSGSVPKPGVQHPAQAAHGPDRPRHARPRAAVRGHPVDLAQQERPPEQLAVARMRRQKWAQPSRWSGALLQGKGLKVLRLIVSRFGDLDGVKESSNIIMKTVQTLMTTRPAREKMKPRKRGKRKEKRSPIQQS